MHLHSFVKGNGHSLTLKQQSESDHSVTQKHQSDHSVTQKQQSGHSVTQKQQSDHSVTQTHSVTQKQQSDHSVTQKQRSHHSVTQKQQSDHSVTQKQQSRHSVTQKQQSDHSVTQKQRSHHSVTQKQQSDHSFVTLDFRVPRWRLQWAGSQCVVQGCCLGYNGGITPTWYTVPANPNRWHWHSKVTKLSRNIGPGVTTGTVRLTQRFARGVSNWISTSCQPHRVTSGQLSGACYWYWQLKFEEIVTSPPTQTKGSDTCII